jgi:hypothetical protein
MQTELRQIVTICGLTIGGAKALEGSGNCAAELLLPRAESGTVSDQTNSKVYVEDCPLVTGNKVAVAWADGACFGEITDVTNDVVTLSLWDDRELPVDDTLVTVAEIVGSNEGGDNQLFCPAASSTIFVQATLRTVIVIRATSDELLLGILDAGALGVIDEDTSLFDLFYAAAAEVAAEQGTLQIGQVYDAES